MNQKRDFYSILGIERNATPEEIRQAYFDAARRLHPDKNVAPGETELFMEVQEAYETLSNPKKRAKYDATLPPEQPPQIPFEQRIIFSRANLLPLDEPQLVYVLLEFAPRTDAPPPPSPPLNLCMIIDRSTSMQGAKMDVVKATALQIIRKLKPQDYFSLVAFSDRAEVIIPAQSGADVKRLESRVQMIQCSGGTEIFSGLETGYNELLRYVRGSSSSHMILLTDGRTYGDEPKCIELARQAAERKITIRGLGIGTEWNDVFLDELASLTGGSSIYISRPEDIQRILLEQINRLSMTYADETHLEFRLPNQIELHYAFRLKPEPSLLDPSGSLRLGPIIQHGSLQVLMEFIVHEAKEHETITLLDGKIGITLAHVVPKTINFPLKLIRPVKNELDVAVPSAEIVSALSKLILYRIQEQARAEVAAGEFERAAEHMQHLATHLLAQGERGLAKTALLEAENIRQQKDFSQLGIKEIKYGTRALLTAGERM
jgi:Ca-activated chloride channel family protein